MVSIDGGTPTRVVNRFTSSPTLSPDGLAVAFDSRDDHNRPVFVICNLPDCSSPRTLAPLQAPGGVKKWTPDSKGIAYVAGTPPNIWVLPLEGKPVRQLTHFTDNREIADLAWSRDGTRLAIARVTTTNDIVLFKGLRR